MPKMTEQKADQVMIAYLIDPANGYTGWVEAKNTEASARSFRTAVEDELADRFPAQSGIVPETTADKRLMAAYEAADWRAVVRVLYAASRAYYA